MRLLLDTHIFLGLVNETPDALPGHIHASIDERFDEFYLSVASIWEIAIKHRLGKLSLLVHLDKLPVFALNIGIAVLEISVDHALTSVHPEPPTRDPFDRLLLAQCKVEGLRLVTVDRALIGHPLAIDAL